MQRLGMTAVIVAALSAPVLAQDVGRFALVQNEVTSLEAGATSPVPAVVGQSIQIDELERTGTASAAKMTFGAGAVISIGQNTDFRVTRQAVDEATGASTSGLDLLVGKLRVFVSRVWGGRPEVEVNTPTAVVGIKGSEIGIEVDEDGRTTVTVLSGHAAIRRAEIPGAIVELGAGERLTVEPDATRLGSPSTVDAQTLADFRASTEPDPTDSIRSVVDLAGTALNPARIALLAGSAVHRSGAFASTGTAAVPEPVH